MCEYIESFLFIFERVELEWLVGVEDGAHVAAVVFCWREDCVGWY